MGRLTWKKPNGDWGIRGVEFSKLDGAVYGALCKLLAYENTGLSPDEIEDLTDFELSNAKKYLYEIEKHRWIPVTEQLPEDGIYLCTMDGELCGLDEPFTGLCGIERGKWDEEGCVLAWMPFPDPMKRGKTDA